MKHAALGSDVGEKPCRSVSSYTLLNRLTFGILYRIRNEKHLRFMREPAAFLGASIPNQAGSDKWFSLPPQAVARKLYWIECVGESAPLCLAMMTELPCWLDLIPLALPR
jgi:hypothetical protein